MPRPHKHMCGRPLDEGILKPAVVVEHHREGKDTREAARQLRRKADFPTPDAQFRRSPSLLWQMNKLKNHGGAYMVRLLTVSVNETPCTHSLSDLPAFLRMQANIPDSYNPVRLLRRLLRASRRRQ